MSEDNMQSADEKTLGITSTVPDMLNLQFINRVPRISCTAGVCGGAARIRGTRIAVWGLEEARRHGISDDKLLQMYPALTRADLVEAWAYVASNGEQINALIDSNNDE